METIGLITIVIWVVIKFFGSGSNNKSSTNNKSNTNSKGGLNNIEKYKTFESFRKK